MNKKNLALLTIGTCIAVFLALFALPSNASGVSTVAARSAGSEGNLNFRNTFTTSNGTKHYTRQWVHYRVGRNNVRVPYIGASYNLYKTSDNRACFSIGSQNVQSVRFKFWFEGAARNDYTRTINIPCERDTRGLKKRTVNLTFPAPDPCFTWPCYPAVKVKMKTTIVRGGGVKDDSRTSKWVLVS